MFCALSKTVNLFQAMTVGYYEGKKESEKPVVTTHFEQVGPLKDSYSRIGF